MSHADFVHLRVRSAYSLAEGALRLGELIDIAVKQRMPAIAVTDSGNLFGALEFASAAAKAGVQPIVGCLVAVRREEPAAPPTRVLPARGAALGPPPPDRVLLLVQDEGGYRNLLRLVSRAFLGTEPPEAPQIAFADLAAAADGLIALIGATDSAVGRLLGEGRAEEAAAAAEAYAAAFPGRTYVEVMRHGMPAEDAIEDAVIDLAYRLDLPLVATNDAHFAGADMFEAHDALLCIADGKRIDEPDRRRLTPEHRLKSAAEMRALFADLPEAVDNTLVIARRCAYAPKGHKPILPMFDAAAGRSEIDEMRAQAVEGLEERLVQHVLPPDADAAAREAIAGPYRERLAYEVDVIAKMGFAGYFLIVAEFIKWAKAHGIPVGPGRGSGAGSVAAWALSITDLDPLKHGLLFERFLNPERVSMPDFDVDFCQDRRDEVIRHVVERYGADRVAQIITFGKLQARACVRDVGRVLGLPYGQVDRISKLIPNNPANPVSLKDAIAGEPALQDMQRTDESVNRLMSIALRLEGLYRHASTHAAGVVIGDRPLDELIPLYRDPRSSMPVTQFNMKYAETAGLVKFDFLGLKTLTVLQDAVALIVKGGGERIDLLKLPMDDRKTFELLSRGDTAGVFQLEGAGMRDTLRRMQPDRFEDIVAVVALYRPGPMENIPTYCNRKHGKEEPDYLHPALEPILKETYGIIVYQEQVMQIAQVLAGYSLGGADLLRRAMGKKIKAEMAAQRETFVKGAVDKGVPEGQASYIFDLVDKFAGYGFNKSHAAAYALIAYQTAWLKANHPVEFMAALMTHDMGNTDKLANFRQELTRLGVALLPPDINRSDVNFSVERDAEGRKAIRYALAAVKNVGAQAMQSLVAEREANGRYADLFDLARRLDNRVVNKRQLENLARAGAFDAMNPNRAQVTAAADLLVRHASAANDARESSQIGLFGGELAGPARNPALPIVATWNESERLQYEYDAIGFYLSAHPLDAYARYYERLDAVRIADLPRVLERPQARIRVAGVVVQKQERTSKKGSRFAFLRISDSSAQVEVMLFSEVLAAARDLLETGAPILVTGEGRLDDEEPRLTAHRIESLDQAVHRAGAGLKVFIEDATAMERLKAVLAGEKRGQGQVRLVLDLARRCEVEVGLADRYAVSPALAAMLKTIPGILEVREV